MIYPCIDLANSIQKKSQQFAQNYAKQFGRNPCLAVILVGDDPASQVYVGKKSQALRENSIDCKDFILAKTISQKELEETVSKLNKDKNVDGILVQSPLPKQLNEKTIQQLIAPEKDVDGFHPQNAGNLLINTKQTLENGLPPCTPAGVMEVLHANSISVKGKHAVVLGRSNIVGKPMALMLLAHDATVTICHSQTKNLAAVCKSADIIVSAIGKAHFVNKDFVKEGAVVIDVGISRIEKAGKPSICGDVNAEEIKGYAQLVTPVPKGIGPMTIAMLLRNTVRAAYLQKSLQ